MTEHEHYVFVLARPTGAKAAECRTLEAMSRRVVEAAWAAKHGVDIEKIRELTSATDTTQTTGTPSSTTCGTETTNPDDVTTDHNTDSVADDVSDIKTDNP
jgi:hypothetical protein